MRSLLSITVMVLLLATSCTKSPDFSELSSNFVVTTNVDKTVSFSNYKTYYISDTIALASGSTTDTIWFDEKAKQLVATVKQNMSARGFTLVSKGSKPDIGMNMIAVKIINIGVVYPGWGWGYPGYWDPWYWGWYYPYYYPWAVTYQVNTGSIGIDMIDLKNVNSTTQKLKVIWGAMTNGALGVSGNDLQNGVNSINQAFIQSPTVKTN